MAYNNEGYSLISQGYDEIRKAKEAEKQADIKNEQEKQILEKEKAAEASEQPNLSTEEQVDLLTKAVAELTLKLDALKGDN
ncbi:hypothetical protein V7068_21830 [Bacillus sp. JJ634]